jgi:hypothetical protein
MNKSADNQIFIILIARNKFILNSLEQIKNTMNKSIFSLFLLLCLGLFSFNSSFIGHSDLLIKKWKPTAVILGEKTQPSLPAEASLEFKKDNTYWLDGKESGTWELGKDQKSLSFTGGEFGAKGEFDGKWEVKKLSSTELELSTILTGELLENTTNPLVIVKLIPW